MTLRRFPAPLLVAFATTAMVVIAATGCNRGARGHQQPNVIILGFDGLDHGLTTQLMADGQLPSFKALADAGHFQPLGTAIPPQSPVAWSDFITGMDAGGHGIFDFIHRDPETMTPYLSTSQAHGGGSYEVGKWRLPDPFAPGSVELLRHGEAFWTVLEEQGVETTVIKMPANFPPSGTASREVSGMGTPDILGSYGTFTFFTSDPLAVFPAAIDGGEVQIVDVTDGVVRAKLHGPENPFLREPSPLAIELTAYLDTATDAAKLMIGDEEVVLRAGEWSGWLPIAFEMVPTQSLPAIARFYLRSVAPHFELYVSPLNMDPTNPVMPISTPDSYAGHLCRCTGYFYTQGMPEETGAVKQGILTVDEFLDQASLAGEENIRQYEHILSEFEGGLLFHYFGNVDLVGHIMWRAIDPDHPAYSADDARYAEVIPDLYRRMDEVVGHTLEHMPEDALLVVMSDHGFASWRRTVHLNTWLAENGYLTLKDPKRSGKSYSNVDWSRTRAYALGLNGLYVNLAGREKGGIVDPATREALVADIAGRLLELEDPVSGERAVAKAYIREDTYIHGAHLEIGPDIQVGYSKGWRGSDESAIGEILPAVFTDNRTRWSGDHCMDHEAVPGILLTSRPLKKESTALKNLAAAILAEYDIDRFPNETSGGD